MWRGKTWWGCWVLVVGAGGFQCEDFGVVGVVAGVIERVNGRDGGFWWSWGGRARSGDGGEGGGPGEGLGELVGPPPVALQA